ncbi:MAG: serine/threonine protein kinase, partial [Phycisphaerae bacterium]|nr:serine/threonine protein kinase [Phycisphaerae bacterium]
MRDACAGDPALQARVERLLAATKRSEGFLETPAIAERSRIRAGAPRAAGAPDAVGDYLVVGVLGVGGMATVYEAVQENPHRRVAIKVLHQTLGHTDAVLRFRLEAETLARLRHPGIAQIYEAGVAPLGDSKPSPFFAMELVPNALSITAYAEKHALPLRERLEMFASVCDAVLHGHQLGVIHRDLKPANVLVGPDGRAKVIDFGIARRSGPDAPAVTAESDSRRLIGTLNAMSPEQCVDPSGIDVRSDVYSLGVILYELVTGRRPHDLSRCSIPEAVRIIVEQEPERAGAIRAEAAGSLDAIIAMAMAKERDLRYVGVGALAADVRRLLADRPVEARTASFLEQARLFARRNRALTISISAIVVLFVGGVIVSTTFGVLASQARDEALQREHDLEIVTAFQESMLADLDAWSMGDRLKSSLASAVARSFEQDEAAQAAEQWSQLTAGVNFTNLGLQSLNESVLQRSRRSIDERFAEQPAIRARLLHRLAATMSALGLRADAEKAARTAYELRRDHLGPDHEETLLSLGTLGSIVSTIGRYDEAIGLLTEAHERSERTLGAEHAATLRADFQLAGAHRRRGDQEEAERRWMRTLESQRRVLGDDHADTLRTLSNVGLLHAIKWRFADAERCWREVIERRRRTLGENHPELKAPLSNLGMLLIDLGRFDEAKPLLEEALASDRRRLGDTHPSTLVAMAQLASLHRESGNIAAAELLQSECVEGRRVSLGPEHHDTLRAAVFLATLRGLLGHREQAEAEIRRLMEVQRRVVGERSPEF